VHPVQSKHGKSKAGTDAPGSNRLSNRSIAPIFVVSNPRRGKTTPIPACNEDGEKRYSCVEGFLGRTLRHAERIATRAPESTKVGLGDGETTINREYCSGAES
jgi:hypothetical protein